MTGSSPQTAAVAATLLEEQMDNLIAMLDEIQVAAQATRDSGIRACAIRDNDEELAELRNAASGLIAAADELAAYVDELLADEDDEEGDDLDDEDE